MFGSWNGERAKTYRRLHDIPHDWGTAVNVQAMVFGNMGDDSATGVAFTRDPSTGERCHYGEYLINAQGEDVVAGIRTPQYPTRAAREKAAPGALDGGDAAGGLRPARRGVRQARAPLSRHDIEFTVERGKLWMPQTCNGKRTAKAALKIAVDMAGEGLISEEEAVLHRPDAARPAAPPDPRSGGAARGDRQGSAGLAGAACGKAVFDADTAEQRGRGARR